MKKLHFQKNILKTVIAETFASPHNGYYLMSLELTAELNPFLPGYFMFQECR
jgi:hypothetical protein